MDIADGGNFMSCVGDGNFMRGGRDGDDIFCVGNGCNVDGRAGDDNVYVENPDGPGAPYPSKIGTNFIDVRFRVQIRTRDHFIFSSGR